MKAHDQYEFLINENESLLPNPVGLLQIDHYDPHDDLKTDSVWFSLIVPTYNEGKNIAALIRLLTTMLDQVLWDNYELIVVDDDSPDLTWKIAQGLMSEYPQLRVMRRCSERGLSTAVIRGWQAARGEILGVIDGDLQHPPDILLSLLTQIQQGADLAVASRHVGEGGVSNWSLTRRFLSRGAQILGLLLLPNVIGRVSDPMSGYFLVRRQTLIGKRLSPLGYKILIEVLGRGNIDKIAESGYVFRERKEGNSKVTWKQYIEYLHHLLRLRLSQGRVGRLKRSLKIPISQLIRFCLVGLSGVFVDMAIFYLFSDPNALGWGLTRSKIIAAEVAIINNFFWNDRWTFGHITANQPGWSMRLKRFLKFNVICLAGLILNVFILNFLFNVVGINRYLANFIAIGLVTIWNFWLNIKLSWRTTKVS
ncbi:sulfonate ABC transporter permease [Aphanothece hegewaldii CCALA 016]|uniref:Dolichol-phosphate mannosyltransferase n=1 Tax=Aphanothece hegewaldii CCALA 016 TaxID=2107694 RepID=A0A2T1M1U1_9CHRO|nr:glycosyltransferase [Aphanothece hegewaldii]PSF38673.1 sulfonate ABC transporter permease [Aphanothece hegewaldii CCALA 016]